MQPLAGTAAADLLYKDRASGRTEGAINSEGFWSKKRDDVRADEVFFHDYFEKAGMANKKSRAEKRAKKAEDDDGGEDETDEEEEGQIWKALVGSRPEIEDGDAEIDEDEDDVDIADFMDDDGDENVSDEDGQEEGGVALDGMEGVSFHGFEEDEGEEIGGKKKKKKNKKAAAPSLEVSDEDDFDVADLEDDDEDAFFDSDDEVPENIVLPEKTVEEVAKDLSSKDRRKRKKSIKSLPVFATAEDYAKLMGEEEDDDL
jgi:ribosome biogenesis protein MAK21